MQSTYILSIVFAISLFMSSWMIVASVSGQPNKNQPVISEIEIPNVLKMTLDKNTSSNIMNVSYVVNNNEKYFLLNITKLTAHELDPDNNCVRVNQTGFNETLYSCFSKNSPDISSAFCNDADECVQAGGRPR